MDSLVTDLFNVEETAVVSDVALANILDTVDDGGADSKCDTVVVRLAHATDRGNIVLDKDMLREI